MIFRFSSSLRVCALVLAALLGAAGLACARTGAGSVSPAADAPLRFGVTSFALPWQRDEFEALTLAALESTFGRESVVVKRYTVEGLVEAASRREVDVLLSSAGAARRLVGEGARPIATIVAPGLEDPNHNEGTAVVVRRDDPRRSLGELQGAVVAANFGQGFSGYQIPMGEIARSGKDPERFFSRTIFFGRSDAMLDVAQAVVQGRADAGFLRLCAFEMIERTRPEIAAALRVLPPPDDLEGVVACRTSTRLYPAQGLSVMPSVSPEATRRLLVALLTMPAGEDGRAWSIATDYHAVDVLLKDLKLGPYAYLRDWTLKRFVEAWWPVFAMALAGLLGLALHARRAAVLVRRREAELEEAHRREEEQEARIAGLQRAGAVGQLSSLIAHEVHQPLAAVRLFAEGLARRARAGRADAPETERIALKIAKEAERAGAVVDRVRDYAKDRAPSMRVMTVSELVARLFENYPRLKTRVVVDLSEEAAAASVRGNPVELELVLVNLLRNAREATKSLAAPEVFLKVEADSRRVAFTVEDNGPGLSDEALAELARPVTSEKPTGLGLGLAIVRHLIERHGGVLSFAHAAAGGLAARAALPRAGAAQLDPQTDLQCAAEAQREHIPDAAPSGAAPHSEQTP